MPMASRPTILARMASREMIAYPKGLAVARYSEADRARWDALVDEARNAHFFFRRDYLDYHGGRFDDHSLMLWRGRRPWAALPAHREGDALVSHAGLSFGGLVVGPATRYADVVGFFDMLASHMRESGLARLVYRRAPQPYWRGPGDEDLLELSRRGARRTGVRVGAAIAPAGRIAPGRTHRHELSHARAAGFEVRHDTVEAAWPLVTDTLRRRHGAEPVHSLEEIRMLRDRFPANIVARTVFSGTDRLAAVIVFISPSAYKLQYYGYVPIASRSGAGEFLDAAVLDEARAAGCWLDLGTSMEPATGELQARLHATKEDCGARMVLYETYEWEP